MYHLIEEAKKIGKKISFYTNNNLHSYNETVEIKEEMDWGISYFFAEVLYQSNEGIFHSIDYAKLIEIKNAFEGETGYYIDIDKLLNDGWLRLVYGLVSIPSAIKEGAEHAEKAHVLMKEINFIYEIRKANEGSRPKPINEGFHIGISEPTITKKEFEESIKKYEEENKLTLNLVQANTDYFWKEKDGAITFPNMNAYKPIIENLSIFLFINKLCDYLFNKEDENKLQINKENLINIFSKSKDYFPKTPSLLEMVYNKQFEERKGCYILNNQQRQNISSNKIAAVLWLKLLDDPMFGNDSERLRFWYIRIVHRIESWIEVGGYLTMDAKQRFIDAACEAIINDPDLSAGENEFSKLLLDPLHCHFYQLESALYNERPEISPVSNDLYEIYNDLAELERINESNLLTIQAIRKPFNYFIGQIVRNDSINIGYLNYAYITKLLKASIKKPYILWKTCQNICEYRPEVISLLLLNLGTESLAFSLLWKWKISSEAALDSKPILLDLLKTNFQLINENLGLIRANDDYTDRQKARIIFQCLLFPTIKKFKVSVGHDINYQKKEKENSINVVDELKYIFSNTFLSSIYHDNNLQQKKLLYPDLLPYLIEFTSSYEEVSYRKNHTISLPFVKLDLLIWILKLRLAKPYAEQISFPDNLPYEICKACTKAYLDAINCAKINGWDFSEKAFKDKLPTWYSHQDLNELIDWQFIFINLEKEGLLEKFINPKKLVLRKAKDRYNGYNRFTAEKIRSHLSILLTVYNNLYNNLEDLQLKGLSPKYIISKIEISITNIVVIYCTDETLKKRINIFDDLFEGTYWTGDKNALFPVIGYTINKFSEDNKRKIIVELMRSDTVYRSFKLLEYLVSQQDREQILSIVGKLDIIEYFKKSIYRKDVQFILQELVMTDAYREKALAAMTYWDQSIAASKDTTGKHNLLLFTFRMKLILAYNTGEERNIMDVEAPQLQYININEPFSAHSEKDFYRALLFLKNDDPSKAYQIFSAQLKNAKADSPVLALNSFAAKLHWAEQIEIISDRQKLNLEALEEWNEYENKLSKEVSLEYIKEKIWHNKLQAYSRLNKDNEFDNLYSKLEKATRLRGEFLEIRAFNLTKRNMHIQAERLLSEAETYHQLNTGNLPDFINTIREIVDTKSSDDFLLIQYNRIFEKSPESIIKIIPPNVNGGKSLPEFILNEIISAGNNMLTFINSISEVKKEDKYSDLLALSLNSGLRNYSWHIGPARGGFSDSFKLNPGEIDFAIYSRKERITICEALILKGKNIYETQKHNSKIFDYGHQRNFLYIIAYYTGKREDFNNNWETYKKNIASIIDFPIDFQMIDNELEDIQYLGRNDSIKAAVGKHKNDLLLYHVFINVNYRLEQARFKKRQKK